MLIAILVPTISYFTSIFRIQVVEKISIGDSKQDVIDILGEPYDYEENSSLFTYYSDDYRKLLEKNDSFNPDVIGDLNDFEDAFQEALELEQKLQTEEYKYIEVRFDSEGKVTSVAFDQSRSKQTKDESKQIEQYETLSALYIGDSEYEITYKIYYQDGSYRLTTAIAAKSDNSYKLVWYDEWGQTSLETIASGTAAQHASIFPWSAYLILCVILILITTVIIIKKRKTKKVM